LAFLRWRSKKGGTMVRGPGPVTKRHGKMAAKKPAKKAAPKKAKKAAKKKAKKA
jgi:hypothetical protein